MLIKVTPDLGDLLVAHSTWWTYTGMTRLFKHTSLALRGAQYKGAALTSMSSYPVRWPACTRNTCMVVRTRLAGLAAGCRRAGAGGAASHAALPPPPAWAAHRQGMLTSMDDFYMLGQSHMIVTETSIGVYDASLWRLVVPQAALSWQRMLAANWLSADGSEWAAWIRRHNSGVRARPHAAGAVCASVPAAGCRC